MTDAPKPNFRDMMAMDAAAKALKLHRPTAYESQLGFLTALEQAKGFVPTVAFPEAHTIFSREVLRGLQSGPTFESLFAINELISPQAPAWFAELNRMRTAMSDLLAPMLAAERAIAPLLKALAPIEALMRASRIPDAAATIALQSQEAYRAFSVEQIELISCSNAILEKESRLGLIGAAADLLLPMARSTESAAFLVDEQPVVALPPAHLHVNTFQVLEDELEWDKVGHEEFNPIDAVVHSNPGHATIFGSRISKLIYSINQDCKRKGMEPVFKATNQAFISCPRLTTLVSTDEADFGLILDDLFFLLYEGSGEAKRLTALVPKPDLEPLWVVKHLRHSMRHDQEHGSEGEIEKKQLRLGAIYTTLCGVSSPRSKAQWIQCQRSLYKLVHDMLQTIRNGPQ